MKNNDKRIPQRNATVILIAVPGETEKRYLDDWKRERRMPNIHVIIESDSNPANTVKDAERRRNKVGANIVMVLLDYDNPRHTDSGRRRSFDALCIGDKPKAYYANPCFEVWALMHFEKFAKPDDSCGPIVEYLKKYLPDYRKGEAYPIFDRIKDNEPTATSNADSLLSQHLLHGNLQPSDRIPSTTMHQLLTALHNKNNPSAS